MVGIEENRTSSRHVIIAQHFLSPSGAHVCALQFDFTSLSSANTLLPLQANAHNKRVKTLIFILILKWEVLHTLSNWRRYIICS